jgi:SAM-dependent methyltransferase
MTATSCAVRTKCPLCSTDRVRTVARLRTEHSITGCCSCGVAWTSPAPTLTADDYAADTVNEAGGYMAQEELFRSFQASIVDFMYRVVGTAVLGNQLLEVGCNVGYFLELACQAGYAAEGVELDRHAVSIARSRGLLVREGTLDETFPDRAYSAVMMSHVLEHVDRPRDLLAQVLRVLRPDGILVLSQPVYDGLIPLLWPRNWYGWQPTQHVWHFSARALGCLLRSEGFHIVSLERNSMHHPWPVPSVGGLPEYGRKAAIATTAWVGDRLHRGDQVYVAARPA